MAVAREAAIPAVDREGVRLPPPKDVHPAPFHGVDKMFDPEAEEYPADPGVDEIDDTNYSTDHPEPDDVSCPDEFSGTDEAENLESEGDSDDPPVLGAAPEAVLATRWVPLDQLTVEYRHWVNPRRFTGLDDEAIGELASDISSKTRQVMTEESETTFAGISEPLDVIQILEPSSNARSEERRVGTENKRRRKEQHRQNRRHDTKQQERRH